MKEIIEVQTGEVKLGTAGVLLKSDGIGSCVVITAYDSKKKLGAIAHVMLPEMPAKEDSYGQKTRYAAEAIDILIKEISGLGSNISDVEVCLAGGANVLKRDYDMIGRDNVESVTNLLRKKNIKIVAESLGGTERRSISLDIETGAVFCKYADEKEKILWKAEEKMNGHDDFQKGTRDLEISNEVNQLEGDRKKVRELELSHRAYLNIMQDLEKKNKELEDVQKACLNIMKDLEKKNREQEGSRKALLNMLQDLALAKKKTEELNNTLEQKVEERTSELKEATVQLIQSEKLTALGELAAGVAHELNQPLNVIQLISQSILRDISKGRYDKEAVENDLPEIVSQTRRMAEIIDHMRIYTRRIDGMSVERIDINKILHNTLKFTGQQLKDHDIEIRMELDPALPLIMGDAVRLEQVFLNLLVNARHALETSQKNNKMINIRTCKIPDSEGIIVEVEDNAGGISEDIKEKIFYPFFTTKAAGKGTGMGLSISKKIIEEHKGKIEVISSTGEGATFRVILPDTK